MYHRFWRFTATAVFTSGGGQLVQPPGPPQICHYNECFCFSRWDFIHCFIPTSELFYPLTVFSPLVLLLSIESILKVLRPMWRAVPCLGARVDCATWNEGEAVRVRCALSVNWFCCEV